MTQKRKYQQITDRDNWTLPFFKASSGFCPFYSPSIFESGAALAHGLDLREERKYRILIIKYMFDCGNSLQLPYNTICIAIIYFHKFFASISIRAHDPYFIATSCLFTSGKQEESRIRLDNCGRFLYEYKLRQRCKDENIPFIPPSKPEMERICKKLAVAELLCTQINKFNYNINLPFDYLLPIISQWKSVYIPHQTNINTLKYIYCLNAFKFIKQSFYIPINIIIPPQKIAIVCMELSLRLNYEKYRQQQESNNNDNEYRYIDPPLQWFRIFDVNQNEQDLKDEIHLLCNEIVNAVQDIHQFGTQKDMKRCTNWRKNTLKMDTVHKEIIQQLNTIQLNNDGYPYNIAKELESKDLLSNNSPKKALHHRYKIQKQVEMALARNNEAISPASLEPHKYLSLYPLKTLCFEDVDREYEQLMEKEKEKEKLSRDKKKKHRKKSHETSSEDDDEDDNDDIQIKDHSENEYEEERKSNAMKTKTKKTKRRENKKRKRSESTEHKKENHHKKRRIVKHVSSDDSSDSLHNHRTSRKDRKPRKHSHAHSSSNSSSSSSNSSNTTERNRSKDKERNRKKRRSSSVDKGKKGKKMKKENKNNNKKYINKSLSFRERDNNRYKNNKNNKRNKNRNKRRNNNRYDGGYFTPNRPNAYKALTGFDACFDDRNQDEFEETAHFDYGLTPIKNDKNNKMEIERDEHESGECTDDRLTQMLKTNKITMEFNEEKTQRNEQEPVSPLLKALTSNNKSDLYNNMLLPSRKDI